MSPTVRYVIVAWMGAARLQVCRNSACEAFAAENDLRALGWRTSLRRIVNR